MKAAVLSLLRHWGVGEPGPGPGSALSGTGLEAHLKVGVRQRYIEAGARMGGQRSGIQASSGTLSSDERRVTLLRNSNLVGVFSSLWHRSCEHSIAPNVMLF